jgi:hypothetical protein
LGICTAEIGVVLRIGVCLGVGKPGRGATGPPQHGMYIQISHAAFQKLKHTSIIKEMKKKNVLLPSYCAVCKRLLMM